MLHKEFNNGLRAYPIHQAVQAMGSTALFQHALAPDMAPLLLQRRALAAGDVVGDSPFPPRKGVHVLPQAVPAAIQGGIRAVARLKKFLGGKALVKDLEAVSRNPGVKKRLLKLIATLKAIDM